MRNTIVSLMTAVALTACAGPKEKNVQAPQEDFNYVVDPVSYTHLTLPTN